MNRLSFVPCLVLMLSGTAHSGEVVQGLFCNEIKQIHEVFTLLNAKIPPMFAVAKVNKNQADCVYVDKISYMIVRPAAVGKESLSELRLTIYEAMLVGVLVGANPRPVQPPVNIFFVPFKENFSADVKI
jgi:hypothetical protein